MKKVLIITLEFSPQVGGIATVVEELARALPAQSVVVLAPAEDKKNNSSPRRGGSDYKIIRKKLLWPKFIWPRWLRLFFILPGIIKKEKIDLLIIHHVLPIGYAAILMKRIFKKPYLLFFHGTDILVSFRSRWKRFLAGMVTARAEAVIFNSESSRRRFLRVLPGLEAKTSVVYPCPGIRFITPTSAGEIEDIRVRFGLHGRPVLLSVGRLADGKGFPRLLHALPAVLKQVPTLVWLVVGDGPKREELIKQSASLGLQGVIRFVGEVPHDALPAYYHCANAFALLTHPDEGREEGLGLVFLEAAAAGLPIVAGRSGGVEEIVQHMSTGIVVDAYQEKEVVEAIVTALTNSAFAKQLGNNAREFVKANFRWDHQIQKLETFIGPLKQSNT